MPKRKLSTPLSDDDDSASAFVPSPQGDDPEGVPAVKKPTAKKPGKKKVNGVKEEEEGEGKEERPPNVDSDYLPLPWKGRIGYACLNTYLRTSSPPIFCSRTCRIDTILKHGHFRNPDGSPGPGLQYVQSLGLQNARDLITLIRWNERYNIKFLRISSEMFPFASHPIYGYDLDFAVPVLREAGRLAIQWGHRLTTHPGQFTQIASPRKEVIEASVKDLEYHCQLLSGLGLEGQADRDAVMILHMGGVFGDKEATLKRFEENYTKRLSEEMKRRLVLENDDVSWSVHDLLPTCESLNIPLVLDYHHHNLIHSPTLRSGTLDLLPLLPRITATWTRKRITQKQHYSEPCAGATTLREMRKHSPRVRVLPPCDPTMDLMIEAKDKEQAVLELYRKYAIYTDFAEVRRFERCDENREVKLRGKKKEEAGNGEKVAVVEESEIGMGGEERRVYWPEGREEWLSPEKKARRKVAEEVKVTIEKEPAEVENGGSTAGKVKNTRSSSTRSKKIKTDPEELEEAEEETTETVAANSKRRGRPPKNEAAEASSSSTTTTTAKKKNTKPNTAVPVVNGTRKSARTRKQLQPAVVDDESLSEQSELSELSDVPFTPDVVQRNTRRGKAVVVES
ncbi:UV-endonuclease UvdE [Ascodesmis nigricans]|uniref:UV-endonuclease UvdE n=1 Tax=Ascodesmis nigricans TaxID=341454 RepID=A0A4S2MIU4_9PEZI|nr:UV-endonuclease UvdE [Ascodesmis nigricans]